MERTLSVKNRRDKWLVGVISLNLIETKCKNSNKNILNWFESPETLRAANNANVTASWPTCAWPVFVGCIGSSQPDVLWRVQMLLWHDNKRYLCKWTWWHDQTRPGVVMEETFEDRLIDLVQRYCISTVWCLLAIVTVVCQNSWWQKGWG